MTRIEIALEVDAVDAAVVQRLKDAGLEVYQGERSWRVIAHEDADPAIPIKDQAMNLANDILIDFRLKPLHVPPIVTLRYEDGAMETALGDLVLEDARRSNDPDPLQRVDRHWWHKARDPLLRDTQDG